MATVCRSDGAGAVWLTKEKLLSQAQIGRDRSNGNKGKEFQMKVGEGNRGSG